MRILSLLLLLTISCSSPQIKNEKSYEKIDSIIQNSETNVTRSDSVNRESEKIIAKKVEQTVSEIQDLKQEIKVAKSNIKTVTITRVDTVYIETKKNFWGKEKTNTKIISDSITVIKDSINN